ncbi:MAG: toll/interleukin-1 receptor domain-containing protein, partial [Gammaproteobacteria bacterium]
MICVNCANGLWGAKRKSEAALGWVTALVQNLNRGPNVAAKEIFIDHQLQPGDAFSEYLLNKVERSALLLILLSQNYLKSNWCGQEIAHFIR